MQSIWLCQRWYSCPLPLLPKSTVFDHTSQLLLALIFTYVMHSSSCILPKAVLLDPVCKAKTQTAGICGRMPHRGPPDTKVLVQRPNMLCGHWEEFVQMECSPRMNTGAKHFISHMPPPPMYSPQQPGTPPEAFSLERKRKRPADGQLPPFNNPSGQQVPRLESS